MLDQIVSYIVMFLLGSVLTYFAAKWTNTFKKINSIEFGVQSMLRDRMTHMHRYYTDKQKPIPQQEVDSFIQMYNAYKKLGGNGYIDTIYHNIVEVYPHENH